MKKSFIAIIALAVLVAAVICTAGCVSEDRITGDWLYLNDDTASVLHFDANETGVFAGLVKSETDDLVYKVSAESKFNWKKTGTAEYQLTFPNETTETVTADMQKGTLVFREKTYEKGPSELSGDSYGDMVNYGGMSGMGFKFYGDMVDNEGMSGMGFKF